MAVESAGGERASSGDAASGRPAVGRALRAGAPTQIRRLRVESYGHDSGLLECDVRSYGRAARAGRALVLGSALVVAAALSVPIPGWHFVAVPGFLLAAFRLAARRLRQEHAFLCARGPCPACGERQRFAIPAALELPHTLACPSCRAFLKLCDLR
jgi:hypothetical protein